MIEQHLKFLNCHSRSVKMNFQVGQFLQYFLLEPIRTAVFPCMSRVQDKDKKNCARDFSDLKKYFIKEIIMISREK